MEYIIGIDGGGTKTTAVIANMKGEILVQTSAGPTNPNVISTEVVFQTLSIIIHELKKQSPVAYQNIINVFAGISGAGNDKAKKSLKEMIEQLVCNDNVQVNVESDPINALYSGTYGQPGIVQISGTGSITYGINDKAEHGRVGGWGYLFGDEGSGYDLGRQGVIAALKFHDGRGNKTILLEMLRDYFKVTSEFDLVQKIYASPSPKNEISPISKMVIQAYKNDDKVAQQIILNVVNEISLSIKTLHMRLFQSEQIVKAVLCGGVFNEKEVLPRLLKEELLDTKNIHLTIPEMSPVGGSVIGAFLMENRHQGPHVIQNIISTI